MKVRPGRAAVRLPLPIEDVLAIVREVLRTPLVNRAALLLLPCAGLLFGLDIAARYGELTHADLPRQFLLSTDQGFGEWVEYAFTATVALLLLDLWRHGRAPIHLANALLFAWLTLDNSLEFHERFGTAFAALVEGVALPLAAQDLGEVLLLVLVGGFWCISLLRCLDQAHRRAAIYACILAGFVGAAAFFGVVVDAATAWGGEPTALLETETFIEDAGEFTMLGCAFLAALGIRDVERRRRDVGAADKSLDPSPAVLPTT